MPDETNGEWAGDETWAVFTVIETQGWREGVAEAIKASRSAMNARNVWRDLRAGEIVQRFVESALDDLAIKAVDESDPLRRRLLSDQYREISSTIGSPWRIDWSGLGRSLRP